MSKNIDQIQSWSEIENIRNISIISHVDHGKTTFSDYLMASGGMLPQHLAGSLRALDDLPEEQKRGITIETSYVSYIMENNGKKYLVNLIDTPGHVDFSGKVAESLRLVDGSFILVDAVEGIMAQTKTVLYQAIEVGLDLVLFINKVDRLILELNYTIQQIQMRIELIIGEITSIYKKLGSKRKPPKFTTGTIIIGSALDGWAIDYEYVKNGGKLEDILIRYKSGKFELFSDIELQSTINRGIAKIFPNPLKVQKYKANMIFAKDPPEEIRNLINECNPSADFICQVGRINRSSSNVKQVSYIVRVLSGSVERGNIVWSNLNSERIKITRVFQMFGRSTKDVKKLSSGHIGGISTNISVNPGDLLTQVETDGIELNAISYVQDPVISMSVEAKDIREIGKVESAIQSLVEATPGLLYENNIETGELVIMGIGTLQLDILKSELLEMNLNVEISDPVILQYEMPSNPIRFISEKIENVEVYLNIETEKELKVVFEDNYQNKLRIPLTISQEAEDGLVEVFRQYMRISPLHGEKVRNFNLSLPNFPDTRSYRTYETGMITGSQLIKEAMYLSQTVVFEPYYEVEIYLPESYIGEVLQEIQKYRAKIEDVTYKQRESLILCKIRVIDSQKLSDNLRQVTDGHGFWSYKSIKFLSKSDLY